MFCGLQTACSNINIHQVFGSLDRKCLLACHQLFLCSILSVARAYFLKLIVCCSLTLHYESREIEQANLRTGKPNNQLKKHSVQLRGNAKLDAYCLRTLSLLVHWDSYVRYFGQTGNCSVPRNILTQHNMYKVLISEIQWCWKVNLVTRGLSQASCFLVFIFLC